MVRKIHRWQRCTLLAVATASMALSGCGADDPVAGGPKTSNGAPTSPERRAESLSTGQIVSVVSTLNQSELMQAQTALERLQEDDVRDHAEELMREHQAAAEELATLVGELGVTLEESGLRANVDERGQGMNQTIAQESTARLAPTFLDVQISMHRAGIATVEQLLLQAQEPELRVYLENFRAKLQGHLAEARRLRKQFPQMETQR